MNLADQLISALLDGRRPLSAIAADHSITLGQLAEEAQAPDYTKRLTALGVLVALRAELIEVEARTAAISALRRILETSTDSVELRRAASTIARLIAPARRRRGLDSERNPPRDSPADPTPPDATRSSGTLPDAPPPDASPECPVDPLSGPGANPAPAVTSSPPDALRSSSRRARSTSSTIDGHRSPSAVNWCSTRGGISPNDRLETISGTLEGRTGVPHQFSSAHREHELSIPRVGLCRLRGLYRPGNVGPPSIPV